MRRIPVLMPLPAVVLAGLFAAGAVAQEATPPPEEGIPEGLTFEGLGFGPVEELPTAPAEIALFRIGIEPGAGFPLDPEDPASALVHVEAGEVTIEADAPIAVLRAAGPGTPFPEEREEVAAGTGFTLETGDSAVFPPRVAGEASNEGSEPAALLVASLGPGEDGGGATPAP